jgi:hypothetical protein
VELAEVGAAGEAHLEGGLRGSTAAGAEAGLAGGLEGEGGEGGGGEGSGGVHGEEALREVVLPECIEKPRRIGGVWKSDRDARIRVSRGAGISRGFVP